MNGSQYTGINPFLKAMQDKYGQQPGNGAQIPSSFYGNVPIPINPSQMRMNVINKFNPTVKQNFIPNQIKQIIPRQNGIINIYFTKNTSYAPILIQCLFDDKISTVIERYRNKTNDRDETLKFIFNSKSLNPTLTCAESGIMDNSVINVISTINVRGAM